MIKQKNIRTKVKEQIIYLQKIHRNRSLPRIYLSDNGTLVNSRGNVLEARVALEYSPDLVSVPVHKEASEYPLNFEGMKVNYDEAKIILGEDCEKPTWPNRISINEWEMQAMMDTFRVRNFLRVSGYAFGVESVYEDKIVIPIMYFRGVRETGEKIRTGEYNPRQVLQYARDTIKEYLLDKRKNAP